MQTKVYKGELETLAEDFQVEIMINAGWSLTPSINEPEKQKAEEGAADKSEPTETTETPEELETTETQDELETTETTEELITRVSGKRGKK